MNKLIITPCAVEFPAKFSKEQAEAFLAEQGLKHKKRPSKRDGGLSYGLQKAPDDARYIRDKDGDVVYVYAVSKKPIPNRSKPTSV
jgi:hypothetical protein